jgi:hypothetical protein
MKLPIVDRLIGTVQDHQPGVIARLRRKLRYQIAR